MAKGTMAECPRCGAKVKKDNLRRHISGVHGPGAQAPKKVAPTSERPASTVSFPWKLLGVLAVVAVLVIAGYWYMTQQPGTGPPPPSGRVAVIETNYGTIKIQLDADRAPRTAGHFIDLAGAGKYDGNGFQRVAKDFVIQGGRGADSVEIAWENTGLRNVAYSVAMARKQGDPNSASCEFFINLQDNSNLDRPLNEESYPYVVFGHVIEVDSRSVVDAIGQLWPNIPPNYDGVPTATVTIISVRIQT